MNVFPTQADIVCDRWFADYQHGVSTWPQGTLDFARHFYKRQFEMTGLEQWQTALALVDAELTYRKLTQ